MLNYYNPSFKTHLLLHVYFHGPQILINLELYCCKLNGQPFAVCLVFQVVLRWWSGCWQCWQPLVNIMLVGTALWNGEWEAWMPSLSYAHHPFKFSLFISSWLLAPLTFSSHNQRWGHWRILHPLNEYKQPTFYLQAGLLWRTEANWSLPSVVYFNADTFPPQILRSTLLFASYDNALMHSLF